MLHCAVLEVSRIRQMVQKEDMTGWRWRGYN